MLDAVENASGGWGVGLHFWAPGALDVANPALQVVVFAIPMLACSFLGIGIGVVFKRWGATGLWALVLVTVAVVGSLVVLITWQQVWGDIGRWLVDQSIATLTIGIPAVIALALAAASFAGLRRTVP